MWNRVVLLTCGMVIGWGLANLWTCTTDEIPRHRYRITLGLVVALALCIWIGWEDPASGFSALLIVALSALVAYAGRARQISSLVERSIGEPVAGGRPGVVSAVILVSHALPGDYTGPEHWVPYLRRPGGKAVTDRGWFSRPTLLERIRTGYGNLGSPPASSLAMAVIQEWLQARLGPDILLAQAHPFGTPRLGNQLIVLASQGMSTILVAPIDLGQGSEESLQQQISQSRVAQRGTQVVLLDNTCLGIWEEELAFAQVDALVHGASLHGAVAPPVELLYALADAIRQRLHPRAVPVFQEASPGLEQ